MKVRIVAAPISVAMTHSSNRLRKRSSTGVPANWAPAYYRRNPAASGLRRNEARRLVDPFDKVLAEPALHLFVYRHQLGDPGLLLLVGEDMHVNLAGRLDLVEGVGIVLCRGIFEERRRFLYGAVEAGANVGRQAVPELLVGDERIGEPLVVRDRQIFLHVIEFLRPDVR